ncbi:MAG: hypothetical protein IJB15_13775, partial [Clostridia bacterium]|nr:hypothetical protein [Clostridia bacterium]
IWKVYTPLTITLQPETTCTRSGAMTNVEVQAEGTELSYVWYAKNAGSDTFTKTTVDSPTYAVKMGNNEYKDQEVYCLITDVAGNCVQTDTVTLRMAATITSQPVHTSAAKGNVAAPSLTADGDGLTYTWYYKDPGMTDYKVSINKGKTCPTRMTAARNGRTVYCVVTDGYGNTETSNTVQLGFPVKITRQPVTTYTRYGNKTNVKVGAIGHGLTYTWYYKNAGAQAFQKAAIKTSAYAVKMGKNVYKDRAVYCVVKDLYGNTVQTDTVILRMAASIIKQPQSTSVPLGSRARITVTAAGDDLTYQWYFKNPADSAYRLATTKGRLYRITMNRLRDGQKVFCRITDKYGKTIRTNIVTISKK